MATVKILTASKPYYTIQVAFGGNDFVQTVISDLEGKALSDFLQSYADQYEADFVPQADT